MNDRRLKTITLVRSVYVPLPLPSIVRFQPTLVKRNTDFKFTMFGLFLLPAWFFTQAFPIIVKKTLVLKLIMSFIDIRFDYNKSINM